MERFARLVVILAVAAGVISGGVAFAADRFDSSKSGKGCGDKNHTHYKEHECKKPPKLGDK